MQIRCTYCLNASLIERLWHFFKKKVLYNQYYEKFKDFEKAVMRFFIDIDQYRDDLSTIMNAEFQLIGA